ncbi:methylenetetrahydrofolate reductase [Thermicanus aegyptius]|uniref:methylenetetrahydrofolate reductase n=1 Tax=Thermicanus aegyptius TaxID=94009 RepID=UPI000346269E|nr:methylenetetrahydrofolate reductase [Thermicanus aegyptius]
MGKFFEKVRKGETSIVVELDPPKNPDLSRYLRGAHALKEAGADAITIADNSLSHSRVANMAVAKRLQDEVGIEGIVHINCRDRNLLAQQSYLLGLHVLGITNLLIVTGDPVKMGDMPQTKSLFELNSIGLMEKVKKMNEGILFTGVKQEERTHFLYGGALASGKNHIPHRGRMMKKVEAGARFFFTQPVYSQEAIEALGKFSREMNPEIPVFLGIMPIVSHKNALFLKGVPGIFIPDEHVELFSGKEGKEAEQVGIELADSLIQYGKKWFNGFYLITPYLRYSITAELTRRIKEGI